MEFSCRAVSAVVLWRTIDFRYSGALKSSSPYLSLSELE